jgi:hypothetical protein
MKVMQAFKAAAGAAINRLARAPNAHNRTHADSPLGDENYASARNSVVCSFARHRENASATMPRRASKLAFACTATALLIATAAAGLHLQERWHRIPGLEYTGVARLYADHTLLKYESVADGGSVKGVFHVTNMGNATVGVESIKPDCGCVVLRSISKQIAPHGTIDIPFDYQLPLGASDTLHRRRIALVIKSGGSLSAVALRLEVHSRSGAALTALPGAVDFGTVSAGTILSRELFLRGTAGTLDALPERIVLALSADTRAVRAFTSQSAVVKTKKIRLELSLPKDAPPGVVISRLQIDDGASGQSQLIIPVRVRIHAGAVPRASPTGASPNSVVGPNTVRVAKESR